MKNEEDAVAGPSATIQDFPIVGIGASAGGLEAFRQFLKAIPENSGMAYVLVQHLYPSHESILPEILSRYTKIPVLEITDDIHLAPNHIYVIPENKLLTSIDGVLKLSPREKESRNAAIDIFFVSLAEVHLELAVGIVLSGTGTDGTLGLKAIKRYGGITFAQDESSSAYSQMPLNAINAGTVDFIMKPEEMPEKLIQLNPANDNHDSGDPARDEDNAFHEIFQIIRKNTGVDFSYYKQSTIRRRLARRMAISKTSSFTEYLKILAADPLAPSLLFNDFLIPVTTFFRDPKVFTELKEKVFSSLVNIHKESSAAPIRIWVAGCSTGEEAYSLAIAFKEFLEAHHSEIQIQIFASDISEASLAIARKGFYKETQLVNVSEAQLINYFDRKADGYQIKKNIRSLCTFAAHNFLKDPPFARMDLISCRNVLIYMGSFIQKKALTTFHYALLDHGFLLLGKSDTAAPAAELFKPVLKAGKVYARRQASGRQVHKVMLEMEASSQQPSGKGPVSVPAADDFVKSGQAVLLADFTPASVIINDNMDIVHLNGNVTPYLQLVSGLPTFSLLKIVRKELAFELRNIVRKAKDLNISVVKTGIPFKSGTDLLDVTIEIRKLSQTLEPYFIIVFTSAILPEKGNAKFINLIQEQIDNDNTNLRRIKSLEEELLQTQVDVNAISEGQEASNEELQSANEELLSGTEELQSLNEELETSKEELQSSNEELININAELLEKQEEINSSKAYIEAIVATLREPIVVLDKNMCIKNINKAFVKKYHITKEEAKAQLIYEICGGLFDNATMRSLLEKVLLQNKQLDDYEIGLEITPGKECILLLNAKQVPNEQGEEQLILLAIEDITERKKIAQDLQSLSDGFEAKVKERTEELEVSNAELSMSIRELNSVNIRLQQFAYIASHDLQEPLRKIQIFVSVLQGQGLPEEATILLDKISASSERMKTLVKDLLSYSYLANDPGLYVATDLNNVVKNIISDFELVIEQKNVEITCSDLPMIAAIPLQMNQLFYNLISNALKFLRTDNVPRIEVSCEKLSAAQVEKYPTLDNELVWYDFTFQDNGIGFEQKYEKQIYTIFQRLHNDGAYNGTGIGLAISHRIVENHGGIIFGESSLNNGAAFHVFLHS
ncbi:CheR family methyltransferase [Flavobacterium sp. DGU11]|uniref:CheR family methyltransferase n=1 Tax=Flavobacterium arundinis TaxID=3139143 RepID=A0ABU9I0H0_9FLAO